MSVKLRYSLLFVGCIAHAGFLALTLAHDFWSEALSRILWPGVFYPVWWALILIWPAWCGVLWKFGAKENRALGVFVPIVFGLIIMLRVLGYLWFWLAVNTGGFH